MSDNAEDLDVKEKDVAEKSRKAFSQILYDKADQPGKKLCISFLGQYGWKCPYQTEEFAKGDLPFQKMGSNGNIIQKIMEIELRLKHWISGPFPFTDDYSVPNKKGDSTYTFDYFIGFNRMGNGAMTITKNAIKNSRTIRKPTSNEFSNQKTDNEPFKYVPILNCHAQHILVNNIWIPFPKQYWQDRKMIRLTRNAIDNNLPLPF